MCDCNTKHSKRSNIDVFAVACKIAEFIRYSLKLIAENNRMNRK